MNEDFLQFIWNFKLFNSPELRTTDNRKLEVISSGVRNNNSGPDFYNAKIRIDGTLWAGTVEIHRKSSDWNAHGHNRDSAYNSVILHVVENEDTVIHRQNGEILPALQITCPEIYKQRYEELCKSPQNIPCSNYISNVDSFKIKFWLNRIAAERMEKKTQEINNLITVAGGDLEAVFNYVLFRYFGFKTNAVPFEMLAMSLPVRLLRKYHCSLFSLEALLFGQAGFLEQSIDDEYFNSLKSEYSYLKSKHELAPMDRALWKFSKLRPGNFPSIRIAQIAALLHKYQSLWDIIVPLNNINDIYSIFDVKASEYWDSHYVFGKMSQKKSAKKIGKDSVNIIIINAVSLMLFVYAIYRNNESMREKSLHFLEITDAESNSIISEWSACGIIPVNALESQALLHLKNEYCLHRKCLKCAIGKEVIKNILNLEP
ncbi:MAG: DUF2851 family protein [Prevotellaceae bacterium]|jgi:hypothetical protein|nr:DUF2851 family protein [Prevotellaceae bacterium]